jgi:hypothetical protein
MKQAVRLCILLAVVAALPVLAQSCGSVVSGTVVLQQNLVCSGTALYVGADNTTIDLNGKSITCSGDGYQYSCQPMIGGTNSNRVGIVVSNRQNVFIKNGTISGFSTGIRIEGGYNTRVSGVTVSGPTSPLWYGNQRAFTLGIYVYNAPCVGRSTVNASIASSNINNQSNGIKIENSGCTDVSNNQIHDNNSGYGDAHGITVVNSTRTRLFSNTVINNGTNQTTDSAIQVVGASSVSNGLYSNIVNSNCGDGIVVRDGATYTTTQTNTAKFNGTVNLVQQCMTPPAAGVFFDLANRQAGPNNTFTPDNVCRTQSAGIPAGVCGPLE